MGKERVAKKSEIGFARGPQFCEVVPGVRLNSAHFPDFQTG